MLLGEALDGLGRSSQAINEFRAAAEMSPSQPNVHFALGYLHWKQKKFEEAKGEFLQELKTDSEHALAKAYLGDVFYRQGELASATRLLGEALRLHRDIRVAFLDLGIIHTRQKEYPRAVAALKRAIQLDPSQTDAHYRLSVAYEEMGRKRDAEAERKLLGRLQERTREELLHKISGPPPAPRIE
jgi:tetratricopeptide (TPR) repeat protein